MKKHLSSGCIIMTVLWPITRSDRTETLNGQSTSIIYNRATSLGVQNKEFVAVSQTDYTGGLVRIRCRLRNKRTLKYYK